MPAPAPAPADPRLDVVDWLKAAAIVAVVVTHAGPNLGPVASFGTPDYYLRSVWASFHVPTFLLLMGVLFGRRGGPIAGRHIAQRLVRLLVPYSIATVLVFLSGAGGVIPFGDWQEMGWKWLTGSALQIYYYVPLAAACILVAWPVSRVPRWALPALALAALAWLVWPPFFFYPRFSFFWSLRDPLMTFAFGYFLIGWSVIAYRGELAALVERHRAVLIVAAAAAIALWVWVKSPAGAGTLKGPLPRLVYTLGTCAGVALVPNLRTPPGWVVALSRWTLPLFLYHNIVLYWIEPTFQRLGAPSTLQTLATTALSIAAVSAACWLLPRAIGPGPASFLFGTAPPNRRP